MTRRRWRRGLARARRAVAFWLDRERPAPEPGGDVDPWNGADVVGEHAREWLVPSLRPYYQTKRQIRRIIVHHTAGRPDDTVAAVRRFHVNERGWSDIGYHMCIRSEWGRWRLEPGRPVTLAGAHDSGQNADSIGLAVFGDYSEADPPDPAQALLVYVLAGLLEMYGLPVSAIEGHRENEPPSTPTICPGFDPARLRAAVERETML